MRTLETGKARRGRGVASLLLALVVATAIPLAADWPQWRGPEGLGVATGDEPLPEAWGPDGAGVGWRTAIPGEGISSPIVSST